MGCLFFFVCLFLCVYSFFFLEVFCFGSLHPLFSVLFSPSSLPCFPLPVPHIESEVHCRARSSFPPVDAFDQKLLHEGTSLFLCVCVALRSRLAFYSPLLPPPPHVSFLCCCCCCCCCFLAHIFSRPPCLRRVLSCSPPHPASSSRSSLWCAS